MSGCVKLNLAGKSLAGSELKRLFYATFIGLSFESLRVILNQC